MPIRNFGDIYSSGDGPSIAALLGNQLLEVCIRKCSSKGSVQEPVSWAAVALESLTQLSFSGHCLLPLPPVASSPITLGPE